MCNLGKVVKVVEVPQEKALTAYRCWGAGLESLFMPKTKTKWRLGRVVRANSAPTKTNYCGLYGFKTVELRRNGFRTNPKQVQGEIKIWGTVVFHEKGYRSTHAEIVKITKGKQLVDVSYRVAEAVA